MILSLARSQVAEAARGNMFGAWSNLVTGARPDGLVDCFLMEADGVVQVAALWESIDAHDRAIGDEATIRLSPCSKR